MIPCDHYVAGFTGESCQPFDLLPAWSRIFTAVRIGTAQDYGIPAVTGHDLSQGLDSLNIDIFHDSVKNFSARNLMIFVEKSNARALYDV